MSQEMQSGNQLQSMQRENPHQLLLEQYKLYVKIADKISERRATTNTFYISLLTALLALLSITSVKGTFVTIQNFLLPGVAFLGLVLCGVWFINLYSYRQLNSGKFSVIHEMEQQLPYHCYAREWEILGRGRETKKYLPLTHVEQFVPILLAIPYLFLLIYSLSLFFSR
jgi:hypothetical protein